MKRITKLLISGLCIVSMLTCPACDFFLEDSSSGNYEIFSEEKRYDIFNGEYREVDADTVERTIINDARYKDEDCYDVWENNLGTYTEYYMSEPGVDDKRGHSYLLRESLAEDAKHQAEAFSDTSRQYYCEDGLVYEKQNGTWSVSECETGTHQRIPDGVDNGSLREGLDKWEAIPPLKDLLVEEGNPVEVVETLELYEEKKILMCETEEYTKVAFICFYKIEGEVEGIKGENIIQQAMAYVFNKDLALIASGMGVDVCEEWENGVKNFMKLISFEIPWQGTISRPADLPSEGSNGAA